MQTFFRVIAASLALASSVAAAPHPGPSDSRVVTRTNHGDQFQNLLFNCDVSDANPHLPEGQTNVTVPVGQVPRFITVGVGLQNYTCTDGKYTSVGAVATLYDVSCLYKSLVFPHIQTYLFDALHEPSAEQPYSAQSVVDALLLQATLNVGEHFFAPTPDGKIKPVFTLASSLRDPQQFVDVKLEGKTPSPDSASHVDWLELSTTAGKLADTTLRIGTHLGQPPAICTAGQTIEVPYAAQYWFLHKKA